MGNHPAALPNTFTRKRNSQMKKKLIAMILAAGAMLGAYAANVRVYVNAPSSVAWGDSWFCYAWDSDPLLGAWPGTQAVKTKTRDGVTWHYLDVTVNGDFGLIVGDGDGKYTEDLDITGVSDGKAYFITVSSERDSGGKYLCVVNVGVVDRTHGKVQLWENGPYWAETNIGADEPWDSGYYFWWGDTIGYKWENNAWVASDGSSSGFSFSDGNAWTYGTDIATLQSEGWITEDGVLAPDHDAAQAQWGGGWRMPTVQDLNDLCYNKCVWIWMTTNGVNGYLVRGKDEYSSASIFLPCTGYGSGNSRTAFSSHGYYWSSVPASSWNNAGGIVYLSNRSNIEYTSVRYAGSPIRPVQDAPAPANQWTSGDCTVTLDSEGTLTVSGTGAMADEDLPPWEEKSDDVKKIVIEDGVTAIGSLAFSDFREATSVQIGKDVARIGGGAFYDCTSLSGELALPNGLTAIGSYAFCQCQNLSGELLLPNGLTTVEMYAFFGCKNFTKVKIPSTVTNIGAGVFADCTGITDVYCHPNAVDLTWGGATSDFKSDGSTKIHVKASQLAAYQEKFLTINATFVGDLPELEFTTAGHSNVTPWYVGDDGNWRCDESDEYGWTMLMTTVVGPGKLSLELKSSSESEWNRLELSVLYPGEDDYHYVTNFGGSTDWIPVELNFDAGVHEVKVGHVTSEFFETKGYGATRNWKWTPAGAEEPVASEVTATIAAIDAIGEVEDTDACKAKIDAARGAYDALTDEQKALVANYDTLTAAEAAYAAFGGGEPSFDVTRPWTAKAKAVLNGAMYDADGNVAGVAQLKVTKPKVERLRESEALVDFEPMIEKAISDTERMSIG